jgi:uncharacterized membrane protein YidH (DUF202 family)
MLAGVEACASPSPPDSSAYVVVAPKPIARVTASALNRRLTGVATWRIYQGTTHVSVMGFDADKRAVETLRVRFDGSGTNDWVISYEAVKSGAVLQLDDAGRVVRNTFEDLRFVYSAERALRAWARSSPAVTSASGGTKFRAEGEGASSFDSCVDSVTSTVKSCGTVIAACAGTGAGLSLKLGFWGFVGGVAMCLYQQADSVGQCVKDGKKAYDTCYSKKAAAAEDKLNPEPAPAADAVPDAGPAKTAEGTEPAGTEPAGAEASGTEPAGAEAAGAQPEITNAELSSEASDEGTTVEANDASTPDPVDPNPGDPEATSPGTEDPGSEPEPAGDPPPPAAETDDVTSASFGAVHVNANASHASARSCRTGYALQCGVRYANAYCRCKQAR